MAYLSNPWVLLLIAIAVYYLIQRLELNIKYQNWKEQRQYAAEAEHVKKNPDLYRARMEAMEKARQKQQVYINVIDLKQGSNFTRYTSLIYIIFIDFINSLFRKPMI